MSRDSDIEYIKDQCPMDHRLAQLAEECAELSQAALKMRRTMGWGTPTPVTPTVARFALMDEMADVLGCILVIVSRVNIESGYICDQMNDKLRRWADRLREAEP